MSGNVEQIACEAGDVQKKFPCGDPAHRYVTAEEFLAIWERIEQRHGNTFRELARGVGNKGSWYERAE